MPPKIEAWQSRQWCQICFSLARFGCLAPRFLQPVPPLSGLSLMDSNLWQPRLPTPVFYLRSCHLHAKTQFSLPPRGRVKVAAALKASFIASFVCVCVCVCLLASAFPWTKKCVCVFLLLLLLPLWGDAAAGLGILSVPPPLFLLPLNAVFVLGGLVFLVLFYFFSTVHQIAPKLQGWVASLSQVEFGYPLVFGGGGLSSSFSFRG